MRIVIHKLAAVIAVLAIMLPAVAACGPTPAPAQLSDQAQTPAAPQSAEAQTADQSASLAAALDDSVTLRIGTTYIWDTPNPAVGWYNYTLRYLLYDTLVEQVGINEFAPGLAENWEVSDDGLVWTFKIRDGVAFHDGTPCTAEDVAWSLNWTIENKPETFDRYLTEFEKIDAVDPTTVRATLTRPVSNMEQMLAYVWILPRSVWEDVAPDAIPEFTDLSAGMGTGPYKLVAWVEGEYLVLEANRDYWRGAPGLDLVVWQQFPTEDAVIEALVDNEIDVIAADVMSPQAIQGLEDAENISLAIMPSTAIDELIINSYQKGTQPATLKDPAVRRAIAYGIDKQRIVDEVYLGYAEPATVVIPPALGDWHSSAIQDIPFNPKEGARILEEAGYKDVNGDGIREDKKGSPLEYRLYGTNDTVSVSILGIISHGLAEMGVSAPPIPMSEASLLGVYPEFDFDLMYWGWGLGADPDFPMRIFTCNQRAKGGWNDSGYCNQEFDALYQQQAVTLDREMRRQLVWDMQKKLFDDRPYIVLSYGKKVQAYRNDRFTGFDPDAGDILWKASFLRATPVQ